MLCTVRVGSSRSVPTLQTNSLLRGWSFQVGPVFDRGGYYDSSFRANTHTAAGLNLGFLRQNSNLFSLGVSAYGSAGQTVREYSEGGTSERFMGSVIGSLDFVIGNKVKSFAVLLGVGMGYCYDFWSYSPLALRVGAYYRNVYFSYSLAFM